MKRSIYMLAALWLVTLASCSKDEDLSPAEIPVDYTLPQGDASKEDNDRIEALYKQYGSYFLYNISQEDYQWTPSSGSGTAGQDSIVLGDPKYVGKMLDFLDDIWLKYLSEDLKKGPGLPYRVMMVDSIKQLRPGDNPPEYRYNVFPYKIKDKAIVFAGMNASLENSTAESRIKGRNSLLPAILNYYVENNIVQVPQAFYDLTDYETLPLPAGETTTSSPENLAIFRNRGFLPIVNVYNGAVLSTPEWYFGDYSWVMARANDLPSYIGQLSLRTDAELAEFAPYPLIQQKFQLLIDAFNKVGIDIRAMANDDK